MKITNLFFEISNFSLNLQVYKSVRATISPIMTSDFIHYQIELAKKLQS